MDIVTLVLFLLFMPALNFFVLNLGSGSLEGCPDCGEENPNDAEECETCGRPRLSEIFSENYWTLAFGAGCCILAMLAWVFTNA